MEDIILHVLLLILGFVIVDPLLDDLVHLWFQVESDEDEVIAHALEVTAGALLLESLQLVQLLPEFVKLLLPGLAVVVDLLPYSVHVSYLVREKIFVINTLHDLFYFYVTSCQEDFYCLSYLRFLLREVLVELLDKFLGLLEGRKVALASRVSLSLDHCLALLRDHHLSLEVGALYFLFVLLREFLLGSHERLSDLLLGQVHLELLSACVRKSEFETREDLSLGTKTYR